MLIETKYLYKNPKQALKFHMQLYYQILDVKNDDNREIMEWKYNTLSEITKEITLIRKRILEEEYGK